MKYKPLAKKAYNLLKFFIKIKYLHKGNKEKSYSRFGKFPYFGNFY